MTTEITATTSEVESDGGAFTLTAGQTRGFYARPQLLSDEYVETLITRDGGSTFVSLGTLINQTKDYGELTNTTNATQSYKLKKSATTQSIAVEY